MKKKDRELLLNELLKNHLVREEFAKYGECTSFEEFKRSESDLLRVLYESIESHDTFFSEIKLYERFTAVLNN